MKISKDFVIIYVVSLIMIFGFNRSLAQDYLDYSFGDGGKVVLREADHGAVFPYTHCTMTLDRDEKILVAGSLDNNAVILSRLNINGKLDSSFGVNGKSIIPFGNFGLLRSIVVDQNGKILLAGSVGDVDQDILLIRCHANGTLDHSFGQNGVVVTHLGDGEDKAYDLSINENGKIVVVGYKTTTNGTIEIALLRYNENGVLDNTFGTNMNGIVLTSVLSSRGSFGTSLNIRPNGKILVAGYSDINNNSNYDIVLLRYHENGVLDNTFGLNSSGIITTSISEGDDYTYSSIVDKNGKILVAGYTQADIHSVDNHDVFLLRYNENGTLDNTFGSNLNGKVITTVSAVYNDIATSLITQEDGKILLAGSVIDGLNEGYDFGVLRYNANGILDHTFGESGIITTSVGTVSDYTHSLVLDPENRVLLAGTSYDQSNNYYSVIRYNSNLSLGTANLSRDKSITRVYPNPIQQEILLEYTLKENTILQLGLYDVTGKPVISFKDLGQKSRGNHKERIVLPESLPSGNYILTLSSGSEQISIELTK